MSIVALILCVFVLKIVLVTWEIVEYKKKGQMQNTVLIFLCCNGIQELFSKNSLCMCSFTLRKVTNAFNQDGQLCAGRGDTVQDWKYKGFFCLPEV